jgi:nitrogen PTS system EIIA component
MWKKFIDKDLIIINPDIKDKESLFEGLVNHVYNNDYIINRKQFLEALKEREEVSNTELSPGIAFPHARSEAVAKLFLSIVVSKEGIEYNNPDMGPVNIVFFFGCAPGDVKQYLQLLAKSSRILKKQEFTDKLLLCQTPDEVIELLKEYSDEEIDEQSDSNYLMLLTLNREVDLSDIMSSLVEAGIHNASIVDSISMAKKLAYEMPIFAGLSYMTSGKSKKSQLIFAYLENKNMANKLAQLLKENDIDLDKKGVGFIQTIKLDAIIGNPEEEIEL